MNPLKTWTNGTPENNYQDGTQLDAADFDSWNRELVGVLDAAGIAPEATAFDQLLKAIKTLSWGNLTRRLATQAEAETGEDDTYQMTPLRVAQAIAAKVASQATELVLGVAKIATQALVDAGADDTTIVTPKKLRWGFSISKGANGFIAFPSWLGGLIIQWGITGSFSNSTTVTLPTAFINGYLRGIANHQYGSTSPYVSAGTTTTITIQSQTSTSTVAHYFVLGH